MLPRTPRREQLGLTRAEFSSLACLTTPARIQAFVSAIPTNFEPGGDTCLSVQQVLRQRRAHCIEAAMVAACALWIQGEPPLIMDIRAVRDDDHVIALYRRNGWWGAISKTNNFSLRYRDPIYRSLRELVLSYFHEYANDGAEKTMRDYSRAFDLRRVDPKIWVSNGEDCWEVVNAIDAIRHYRIVSAAQARALRRLDRIEMNAREVKQFRNPSRRGSG